MSMMIWQKLKHDMSGNGLPLVLIVVLVLTVLSVVIYTVFMLHVSYQEARDGLERSGIAAVNKTMRDVDVRDIDFNLYIDDIWENLEDSLVQEMHLEQNDTSFKRMKAGYIVYAIDNVQLSESNGIISITAELTIPLPWDRSGQFVFRVPVLVRVRSLYLG